ncbi:mitochondrial peptide methionine sulfoxide reductase isoform X2 [Leopardus geoffroyi]|uniref:mitochondrial peptide methionine sulfoxide reductase isoform X2 n=1 Tax=Leopardus geoffroyi TaxID=46844 RepID=UPI001E263CA0|nr:mitochondrial peptide methionine sulfoxide reductase isoform X2 [Leopardus geoffroyi]
MLLATRRASQLFHSLFPVPRMGDSASKIVSPQEALPGRKEPIPVAAKHHVNGNRTVEPFPEGTQMAVFGMGCFWGAERKFWTMKGVYSTQVGYAGGYTSNPTYKEVCSGKTGHAEVVRVVYQPERISFEELLKVFWENHDPTQGMRQGNDHGSQYRSAIYPTSTKHLEVALRSKEDYQKKHMPNWERPVTKDNNTVELLGASGHKVKETRPYYADSHFGQGCTNLDRCSIWYSKWFQEVQLQRWKSKMHCQGLV